MGLRLFVFLLRNGRCKYSCSVYRHCSSYTKEAFLKHRYKCWDEERKSKLTASTFTGALGFRKGSRVALWKEKSGLAEPFNGCPATWWNNFYEETALAKYKLITGNDVTLTGFHVYDNNRDDWLAASPDGLIQGQNGVLEIKCPFMGNVNNDKAMAMEKEEKTQTLTLPWDSVPVRYMPQAQGLMEILDREWMDFFVWTPGGSCLFRIKRDPEYWDFILSALRDFWWKHVVPVKTIRQTDLAKNIENFQPSPKHHLFQEIWAKSQVLVNNSRLLVKELHQVTDP